MKIYIKTYGCQSNIADSEVMAGLLKHKIVNTEKKADIIIINSCSVKNSTQSSILHYLEKNKNKKLIVTGCLTKTLNLRKKFPNLLAVTNSILKINDIIKNNQDLFVKKEKKINLKRIRKNKDIAIINISQGCLGSCTYCSVKFARGNLKSYKIEEIKREFKEALKENCKTIYLTSQDNSCYGFDINTSLPKLIDELTKIKGTYTIRVGMMNPLHLEKIYKPLINSYKNKHIMKFLHIPIQSGSQKVLTDMNRSSSIKKFKNIIKDFRKEFKNISIATDVIIGYPTETDQDFKKTLKLLKELKPEVLNISMFSSRNKTKASKLPQLKSEIIKERSKLLQSL